MVGQWRLGEEIGVTEGLSALAYAQAAGRGPVYFARAGFVPFNIVPIEYVVDAAHLSPNPQLKGARFTSRI